MAKPKFFRILTEGDTTDGRTVQRSWIEQIARNYDRAKYGARIWLEHIRGILPDSPFRAYGDVTAVRAEEVEIDGMPRLALYAQIDPTADLVALSKARQKIYTSAEIAPDFAKTGEAYLVGLAVTDSPASLGTEVLAFASQHPEASPFAGRKQDHGNVFTAAAETDLHFDDETSLLDRVKQLFARERAPQEARFADIKAAVESVADHAGAQAARIDKLEEAHLATAAQLAEGATVIDGLRDELAALAARIDHAAAPDPQRPAATGGSGIALTNC